jgi:NAD(P)-dependent dehydrogenase (short-subunit alcohol dehydrogenase family)
LELEVTSDDSIAAAARQVEQRHGGLDVLFNNAGIMVVQEPSLRAEMHKVMDVNTIGAACVAEAFLPLLRRARVPRLLFISSGMGSIAYIQLPFSPFYTLDFQAYSTSKAAVNMIGSLYAVKLHKEGIKVDVIDLGFRATNINGFNPNGGDPAGGALEACRLIVDDNKDGQHGTFTATEGIQLWRDEDLVVV